MLFIVRVNRFNYYMLLAFSLSILILEFLRHILAYEDEINFFRCWNSWILLGMEQQLIENFTAALRDIKVQRVPPPMPYKGVGSINDFFENFERYAHSLYENDARSYLQILPSFLEGETKNIALSFGTNADYATVKARVISESERRSLGSNNFTDFFATKRLPGESLLCYSIRLESLASKIPNSTLATQNVMKRWQ